MTSGRESNPGRSGGDDFPITFGVEEEFFLVDPESRTLLADPDPGIFETCDRTCGPHRIVRELLRTQIETNTRICASLADVRTAMRETRRVVVDAAQEYGAAVMAASTHPFAEWRAQITTPKERYERFALTFQESVRRFLVGGMHIHAGFGDPDSRIRVMTALRRYLPVLHALSTSSPFNGGHDTGFKSYRLSVIGGLPRTSLPAPLWSRAAYDRLLTDYQRMEFVNDGSELWWDIRPSHAYPTIEMRICDVCTRIEDALTIAALYGSLIRWLARQDRDGALPPEPPTEIIAENRWLAQRYGTLAFFGNTVGSGQADTEDFCFGNTAGGGGRVDIEDFTSALVEELAGDARALGCETELRRALAIIREGASADRQLDLYRLRRLEGDTEEEALYQVVDHVLAETREGIGEGGGSS